MKILKYLYFLLYLGKSALQYIKDTYLQYSIRQKLLFKGDFQIGKNVVINNYENFTPPVGGKIGDYSRILQVGFTGNIHRDQSITLGKGVIISRHVELTIWEHNHLIIKDHTSLQDNCKLLGGVTIERNCLLAPNVFMSSGNHYFSKNPFDLIKNQDKEVLSTEEGTLAHVKPIHVEEDCWIGLGSYVKRGVYIGRGAVVGAYTLVTRNIPPYSIQSGSPNTELKKRINFNPPTAIYAINELHWPYFYRGFAQQKTDRKESLKQNGLFAFEKALITLKKQVFSELKLNMFFSENFQPQLLAVKLNDVLLIQLHITSDKTEYIIPVPTEVYEKSIQNLSKFPDVLQKYHLFTFELMPKVNSSVSKYGVVSCEIY
ncbi:acyltransferase [Microscilla marina]|uniref:Uncharacterized protein n=1 Tax=Microscilla marina ATCC 23134 TaxID=313606 RepID=A1ZCK5_MICM2|nr:acyltransferase [Microscilla marina]EAY32007.1 hypothetical protein M23134_02036 [Microscilla marina ATCC 23134]